MVSAANVPDGANNVRLSTDRTEAGSDVAMPLDPAVLAEKERHDHVADEKADEDKVDGGIENQQDHQDTAVYPKGLTLTFIIVALCMAVFLVALDQTIIAPALGAITAEYQSVKDIVGVPFPTPERQGYGLSNISPSSIGMVWIGVPAHDDGASTHVRHNLFAI
jgi:hypothetical protein